MKNDAWFKIEMLSFRISDERRRRIMRTTKRNYFVLACLAIIAFVMLGFVRPAVIWGFRPVIARKTGIIMETNNLNAS